MFNRKALSGSAGAVAAFAGLLLSTSTSAEDYTVVGKNSAGWRPHSTVVMVPTAISILVPRPEKMLSKPVFAPQSAGPAAMCWEGRPIPSTNSIAGSPRSVMPTSRWTTLFERARGETTSGYPVVASVITLRIAE